MDGTKWLQRQEHFDWLQKCLTCWKMCEQFITLSIHNGQYLSSINACRDVTEICCQCIKFEAQRSPFFKHLCDVCAEICDKFAFEIEKFEKENELLKETLHSCRIFADECRKVVERQKLADPDSKGKSAQKQRRKT